MELKRRSKVLLALSYLILILGAIAMLIPFVWMVTTALKGPGEAFVYPPTLFGKRLVWENFTKISDRFPFFVLLRNTAVVAVAVVTIQLVTSAMAGFAFSYLKFRFKNFIFMFYLVTIMIPYHVLLVPQFALLKDLNLLDSLWALILPVIISPFGAFLMRQGFESIPSELGDAAKIDGCNPWGVFSRIYLPLNKPVFTTLGIFALVGTWNDFLKPLIFISNNQKMTLTLGIYAMQGAFATDWPVLMATVTLSVLPVIIVFLSVQDVFVRGVALTGMK